MTDFAFKWLHVPSAHVRWLVLHVVLSQQVVSCSAGRPAQSALGPLFLWRRNIWCENAEWCLGGCRKSRRKPAANGHFLSHNWLMQTSATQEGFHSTSLLNISVNIFINWRKHDICCITTSQLITRLVNNETLNSALKFVSACGHWMQVCWCYLLFSRCFSDVTLVPHFSYPAGVNKSSCCCCCCF